jgi:hypothetical protein
VIETADDRVIAERDHPRAAFAGHTRPVQEFYFGADCLLRRHHYQVDISASFLTAQYVYAVMEAHGIEFPTQRRAHPRGADGRPDRDRAYLGSDLSDFSMS